MEFLDTFVAGPYNAALTAAVIVGLILAFRAGRAAGTAPLAWSVLLVAAAAGGLIGSKFIFFDLQAPEFGAKSNLGGIVAGVGMVLVLARVLGLGTLRSLDAMAVPTLAGMAIGRVGCFLAGCCTGTHTTLPWGVQYEGDTHAVHPVQLYEAGADLLLIGALARWIPLGRSGHRFGTAVASYAAIRFVTEFVRADREIVSGLNPVQWSMLAIGAVVALWVLRRARKGPARVETAPARRLATSQVVDDRAFVAAMLLMGTLLALAIGIPAAFTPLERVVLVAAGAVVGSYALLLRLPRWLSRPLVPSFGALLLLQVPPDAVPRKREVLVGGAMWSGVYSAVVGSNPTERTDYCEGGGTYYEDIPTRASRRSTTGLLSVGYRERRPSGKRLAIEGQLLTGQDKLRSVGDGAITKPLTPKASILAGGATATVEGKNHHLRVGAIGGTLSKFGYETSGVAVNAQGRTGVASGFFLEGNLSDSRWYATTGDFSYAGVGRVVSSEGARLVIGAGAGVYFGAHVPVRGLEFDAIVRIPENLAAKTTANPTLSIGLKKAFTLRP